jgi:hypothetical protein
VNEEEEDVDDLKPMQTKMCWIQTVLVLGKCEQHVNVLCSRVFAAMTASYRMIPTRCALGCKNFLFLVVVVVVVDTLSIVVDLLGAACAAGFVEQASERASFRSGFASQSPSWLV